MQENITEVALELADYVHAARYAGGKNTVDVMAGVGRLLNANGAMGEDVLAILAYAQLFLSTAVSRINLEEDDGVIEGAFRFVHKAVTILENATGKSASEYI
ncbi:hypothetical protein [Brucella suis]|uniref:Uncharacterized protein n=1 Tax=Brucella suis (strain ATCC 23445 / NCTC 10510) TaxID=470137 RepID=B0CJB1_BRUSI|nr:hypothetical protein [Brucella suis]ABY37355.1 Hypothetical protein, conserved [Brucella suis ATCC 23445]ENR22179.1 hypothetical protein C050_00193 [Brucella suis 92/63]ENR29336.1 hypothetical protein C978_00198 [Brucella suis 94/11]ENR36575.1 hypothetical protein C977_00198 [Brucella suis F4/06-146]ENR36957.1 hypothetical protein C006_00218 [Brucella suis F5/03-2]